MAATKDPSEPGAAASSMTAGSVALLPEPFEVNERAVSLAARAAREVLQRLSAVGARRPARREAPAAAAPAPPPPAAEKSAP